MQCINFLHFYTFLDSKSRVLKFSFKDQNLCEIKFHLEKNKWLSKANVTEIGTLFLKLILFLQRLKRGKI